MKRIFLFFGLFFMVLRISAQHIDTNPIRRELELSSTLNKHFYGFCLYDLDSNRFLMGLNESKLFTPASNAKTFTLFAALKNLGDSIPGLRYVERGDSLIFWGTGDPTFLHNRLDSRKVYDFLKSSNKKLYYALEDEPEETFYRKGWSIEDYEEYYQPEISSFPIYGNVVTFREKNGQLRCSPSFFQGATQQKYKPNGGDYNVSRAFDQNMFVANRITAPRNYVNEKPFRYSADLFIQLLVDTLQRPVKAINYRRPADIKTIYSNATHSILREMMLPSDNFLAEQFHMLIAQQKYGRFDSARFRKELMNDYFRYFTDEIDLYDGSGLSTYNKVTPRSMVEILLLVHAQVPNVDSLHRLFPTGGVDGTIRRAYSLDNGEAFVWAKTGTINAVHNQSGFIRTRSGRNLAFAFLNTNFLGDAAPVRKEMVRIITFIRQHY